MQRPYVPTIACLLSASVLAACDATYKYVSGNDVYRPRIGSLCTVQRPLNAYGVAKKLERQKKTDLVALSA